jgi:hypothetical protein
VEIAGSSQADRSLNVQFRDPATIGPTTGFGAKPPFDVSGPSMLAKDSKWLFPAALRRLLIETASNRCSQRTFTTSYAREAGLTLS